MRKNKVLSAPLSATPKGLVLCGFHAVRAAWLNPRRHCSELWLTEESLKPFEKTLAEGAAKKMQRPHHKLTTRAEIDKLLPGQTHQGIALRAEPLAQPTLKDFLSTHPHTLLLLDQVTDPHNVGAIVRSAAAFGMDGVVITEKHAASENATLAKAASGALDLLPLITIINLAQGLALLKKEGFWITGLAGEAKPTLPDIDLSGKVALVLGAEGYGLRPLTRQHCDHVAKLPTRDDFGTLNVSNAAAVALYILNQQRNKT
ncbi:MAG: 23S rRNA (guanosine(2251)-2'-O)-methyltransferase RlmB [Alphaproteobacteria bacterium]|nr:23S rRNA (guanosine(2251)-2'-O)-methyltransferase RlmB [Alphaproteobacteria bacterium]